MTKTPKTPKTPTSPSPPKANEADSSKPIKDWIGARHHKRECECRTCVLIRRNHSIASERRTRGEKVRDKPLSKKERSLVEALATNIVATGKLNQKDAAVISGYSEPMVSEKMGEDRIRQAFRSALHAKGVTPDRLAEVLASGLDANDTKFFILDGQITSRESPDWLSRHKFVETSAKILGAFPKEQVETTGAVFHLHTLRVLTPGHEAGCRCPDCDKVRRTYAAKCLEQANAIPAEYRVTDSSDSPPSSDDDD